MAIYLFRGNWRFGDGQDPPMGTQKANVFLCIFRFFRFFRLPSNIIEHVTNNMKQPCVCVFFSFFHKHVSIFSVMYSLPHVAGVFSTPMTLIVEAGQASFAARHLRHQNAHQKALKHLCKTNLQHHVKIVSYRASSNQQATEVEVYHLGPARGPNEEIWGKYLTHKNWTCQPIHWLLHPHLLLTKSGILQAGLQD